jgi:type 1 glutamine amidotransferase
MALRFLSTAAAVVALCIPRPDAAQAQPGPIAVLSVSAGAHARVDTPVAASLDGVPRAGTTALVLVEVTGGVERPVRSQVDGPLLRWVLDGETAPGAVRAFELRASPGSAPDGRVGLSDDGAALTLGIGERPVLSYRYAMQPAPEGAEPVFARSGFIHPLWSPGGAVLTRIQPPDHLHHYGIWNPWTSTEFEGRAVDFWNIGSGQGTVRATNILERRSGPVAGGFRAALEHVAFGGPAGEKVALDETWDVTAWDARGGAGPWIVDFVSTLSPASDVPLTVKGYRYQGFSIRATGRWSDANSALLTSEGLDKSTGNATRARWIDLGGETDVAAGRSGLVMMTHPANFNHPEHLRIWPTGMNEGQENVFVNFNPAQDRDWVLGPGGTYVLRYRLVVYDGAMPPDVAERHWADFADPPRVTVHATALRGARVFVYTRNGEGYVHDNIASSVAAIRRLGEAHGFTVESGDDPTAFTPANLARFDALVFANTNNEAFDSDDQREALQAYVRAGGGFVGIHSASGSERDWPWYSALVGGNFERHAPQQDFTVEVVDASHPSTAFLPRRWEIASDECYYHDELNPGIRVLLAADLSTVDDPDGDSFPGTLFADRYPVAWYQAFDGGRQFFTALGHRPDQYGDPAFLRHILGGIQWVVNGGAP